MDYVALLYQRDDQDDTQGCSTTRPQPLSSTKEELV